MCDASIDSSAAVSGKMELSSLPFCYFLAPFVLCNPSEHRFSFLSLNSLPLEGLFLFFLSETSNVS